MKFQNLVLSSLILVAACKKEQTACPEPIRASDSRTSLLSAVKVAPDDLASKVTISSYGFLILDSTGLAAYSDFLYNNNSSDINDFISAIGFSSQASIEGQARNYFDVSAENSEYMFSEEGIVQIGDIVIRGLNSNGYFLAMQARYLDANTFSLLKDGTFDSHVMCKLRIGADYGSSLRRYVINNTGHDGFDDPVMPDPSGKFWGYGSWYLYDTLDDGTKIYARVYYMFWCPMSTEFAIVNP